MPTYTVVTTFHQAGYTEYAQRMLQTFISNWPETVQLLVYAENCQVAESAPNMTVIDAETVTDLQRFKQRWSSNAQATGRLPLGEPDAHGKQPGIGFKWDAVRFSNKIYAVCDAATRCNTDWLIWMDADSVCHSLITEQDIARLLPESADICYLGRRNKYSECGLYALNLNSLRTSLFLLRFKAMYDNAEKGIFQQSEWHDSYIFDRVMDSVRDLRRHDWAAGLITGEGHPLINSEWGQYLDHLKGKRKQYGRSLRADLNMPRTENYWQ